MASDTMDDELGELLLQYGAITRQRVAVDLLATRGQADAARRKVGQMEHSHHAARRRFLKRWGER